MAAELVSQPNLPCPLHSLHAASERQGRLSHVYWLVNGMAARSLAMNRVSAGRPVHHIRMAFGDNTGHRHHHRSWVRDHRPRHGPQWQHNPNITWPQMAVQASHRSLFLIPMASPVPSLSTAYKLLHLFPSLHYILAHHSGAHQPAHALSQWAGCFSITEVSNFL